MELARPHGLFQKFLALANSHGYLATLMHFKYSRLVCALAALAMAFTYTNTASALDTYTLVDSEGFEAPLNTTTHMGTGQLVGQLSRVDDGTKTRPWNAVVGVTSTAVVQNSVAAPGGGTQSLRVDRAPNSFDRWAVPIQEGLVSPFVLIEWDMMIPSQPVSAEAYGPVFGVEAYDDHGGLDVDQLAFFGVDIATREVLFQNPGYAVTSALIEYDEWNHFAIVLNYNSDTYQYYFNGVKLGSTVFVDANSETNELTDVDIAALPGYSDSVSLAATGTAYFDNFAVRQLISSGDFNGDGAVDASDYVVWRNSLGNTGLGQAADANFDGVVNHLDYLVWKADYTATNAGGLALSPSQVPEPATMGLVLVGAAALAWRLRRVA